MKTPTCATLISPPNTPSTTTSPSSSVNSISVSPSRLITWDELEDDIKKLMIKTVCFQDIFHGTDEEAIKAIDTLRGRGDGNFAKFVKKQIELDK